MTLLTAKEVMELLRVKRSTLYTLRKQGLPVIRLGRSIRFDKDEVIRFIRTLVDNDAFDGPAVPAEGKAQA